MKKAKAPVQFCWLCSKQLYQRRVSEIAKIDRERRTLHKACAEEVRKSADYIRQPEEFFSAQWVTGDE